MLLKNISFKKWLIRSVAGLAGLFLLVLIYFIALSYFHKCVLVNQPSNIVNLQDLNASATDNATSSSVSIIEKINEKLISFYSFCFNLPLVENKIISNNEDNSKVLYLGSFPYTSSIVDTTKNGLRFDGVANAIMFPLNYDWLIADTAVIEANKNKFDAYKVNDFKGPYDDKRCLQNNCLEIKGDKLFYNSKVVSLPSGVKDSELHAISLGTVSNQFLVGFTLKSGEYKSEVFYFNDSKFTKIPNFTTISSSYPGLLGFGGETDDFLIIYGAYKGQAWRIRGNKITNLDQFVDYRFMNNGFKPEIIRAKDNSYINWYIYSATLNNPQIIKLWQSDNGEIIGATSLLNDLKIKGQSTEFKLLAVKAGEVSLLARTKTDDRYLWQIFRDRGFKNNQPANLVTLPINHDANKSEIIIKKIYNSQIVLDAQGKPLVKVDFSIDGLTWQEVLWGQNIDFPQLSTKSYFLKVLFLPTSNQFYSPYISSIIFSYVCNI